LPLALHWDKQQKRHNRDWQRSQQEAPAAIERRRLFRISSSRLAPLLR